MKAQYQRQARGAVITLEFSLNVPPFFLSCSGTGNKKKQEKKEGQNGEITGMEAHACSHGAEIRARGKKREGQTWGGRCRKSVISCRRITSQLCPSGGAPRGPNQVGAGASWTTGLQMGPVWQEAGFCCHH